MTSPRIASAFGIVVLVVLVVLIAFEFLGSPSGSLGDVLGASWGRVMLADLYFGLAIAGAWMWRRESSLPARLGWAFLMLILGNIAVGAYLVRAGSAVTWQEFFSGSR